MTRPESCRLAAMQAEEARRLAEEKSTSILVEAAAAATKTKVICIETQTELEQQVCSLTLIVFFWC